MRKTVGLLVHAALAGAVSLSVAARPASGVDAPPPQDPVIVADMVTEFLEQQAGNYPGSAHVTVDANRVTRQPECDDIQIFLPGGQRLRPRMSIGVRCLDPVTWTSRVQATMAIHGFFYVANRNLEPGETVSLDDLIAREGDILSLSRGVVVDPSQLIDHIVTQRIPAGTPLKSGSVRNPMSVQRGQMVRTEARGIGFVATGEAQTLEDGAPGEQIRVRTSSGQIITGVVMDAHTVQVMM